MRLPPKTARWKRCVPRLALINVWISKGFYLHSLQLIEACIEGDSNMTRKTLLVAGAGAIALAISTTSLITKSPPTAVAKPIAGMRQARSSHYPWYNSYKAVVDQ